MLIRKRTSFFWENIFQEMYYHLKIKDLKCVKIMKISKLHLTTAKNIKF